MSKFNILPKLNYKKMLTQQKRVSIPLFYCCMLAKGYINLHKKFLRHRDQQYVSRYHHFEQKLRYRL